MQTVISKYPFQVMDLMRALKAWEKILVYLLEKNANADANLARFEFTQYGIAEHTDLDRAHVSIALKKLKSSGYVDEKLEHIKGQKRRMKAYFLTYTGMAKAQEIKQEIKTRIGCNTIAEIIENERKELAEEFEDTNTDAEQDTAQEQLPQKTPEAQKPQEPCVNPAPVNQDEIVANKIKLLVSCAAGVFLWLLSTCLIQSTLKSPDRYGNICWLFILVPSFVLINIYLLPKQIRYTAGSVVLLASVMEIHLCGIALCILSIFFSPGVYTYTYYLVPVILITLLAQKFETKNTRDVLCASGLLMFSFVVIGILCGYNDTFAVILLSLSSPFFVAPAIMYMEKIEIVRVLMPVLGFSLIAFTILQLEHTWFSTKNFVLIPYLLAGLLLLTVRYMKKETLMEYYIAMRESAGFIVAILLLMFGFIEAITGIYYAAILMFLFTLAVLAIIPKHIHFPVRTIAITLYSSVIIGSTLWYVLWQ